MGQSRLNVSAGVGCEHASQLPSEDFHAMHDSGLFSSGVLSPCFLTPRPSILFSLTLDESVCSFNCLFAFRGNWGRLVRRDINDFLNLAFASKRFPIIQGYIHATANIPLKVWVQLDPGILGIARKQVLKSYVCSFVFVGILVIAKNNWDAQRS